MRVSARHRSMFMGALAGLLALPVAASAEDKIYPPGTDCANQPTIAARLLCGRQEFRRQSGTSVEQPMEVPPSPEDRGAAFQEPTPAPTAVTPIAQQPRTSSPNH